MEKNDQELLVISTSEDAANKKKNIISTANNSNKKGSSSNSSSSYCSPIIRSCQADKCSVDLSDAKQYHKRHKVCEYHAKSQVVVVAGLRQRFCQQCSRFHEVTEFDESKRSCRRRLAGHNERRRKSISSLSSSSSADHHQTHNNNNNKDDMNMMFGDKGRIHISIPQNFHLR